MSNNLRRLIFSGTIILVSLGLSACEKRDPTDEAMLRNFREHRAEFERLREMVSHDVGLRRVDKDWTDPSDPASIGVSPDRIADYRILFRQLGIPGGFQAYGDGAEIKLIAHAEGLAVAGHAKNFVWRTSEPDELVKSIDEFRIQETRQYQDYLERKAATFQKHWDVYRKIDGNWYLNYES